MTLTKTISGNNCLLTISGAIDADSGVEFMREITLLDDSLKKITLDFLGVEYISGIAIKCIIVLCKKFKGKAELEVINACTHVKDILTKTGVSTYIKVESPPNNTELFMGKSFREFFAMKMQYCAEEILIHDKGRAYTWRDIDTASQVIAGDLYNVGVRKRSHVGLMGENSFNWVCCFVALQKLGAIAVMLNPHLTYSEIADLSEQGDITHICIGDLRDDFSFEDYSKDLIKDENSAVQYMYNIHSTIDFVAKDVVHTTINFEDFISGDDPCFMLFSSGSTAKPKAVMHSSYLLLKIAQNSIASQKITKSDRICQILPIHHIFGFLNSLIVSFLSGAELFFAPDTKTSTILGLVSQEKCTIMNSVPTLMLAIANNKNFDSYDVSSLRSTVMGGSTISPQQVMHLKEKFPNTSFGILYGLSEAATVTCTPYGDTVEHICHTVGKADTDVKIKIIRKEDHHECSAGEVGEVWVKNPSQMICYYKLDLEKQPFDESGWLNTEDLGFLDEEGYLHFAGRSKEIIIRGGENILPGEIAAAITEFTPVADAKVFGAPHDFWGEEVAACLILKEPEKYDEDVLRTHLSKRLAKYKIPAYFVIYDKFPLLSNGKIDNTTLKEDMISKVKPLQK